MIVEITNTPRDYAWGSLTAIAHALGREASGRPEAELWLGAHPGSPTRIVRPELVGGAATLLEWITRDPVTSLGARSSATGNGGVTVEGAPRLPFLLKILAADQPLSLQAHPSPERALEGFVRENALGIPVDSPERNYRDASHKPELIVALSPKFEALCGFRPLRDVREILRAFCAVNAASADPAPGLFAELECHLRGEDDEGGIAKAARPHRIEADAKVVRSLVEWFLAPDGGRIAQRLVHDAEAVATQWGANEIVVSAAETVRFLGRFYPGDPGVALSLLLNRVTLCAGQALYLPAGNIHAYLSGLGIELMASSDNVVRGGLTSKHVDVPELLGVLDFAPLPVPLLAPDSSHSGVTVFRPDVPDFVLMRVEAAGTFPVVGPITVPGPAIILATEGHGELRGHVSTVSLSRGQSFYVTPDERELEFRGEGVLFVATVGA